MTMKNNINNKEWNNARNTYSSTDDDDDDDDDGNDDSDIIEKHIINNEHINIITT